MSPFEKFQRFLITILIAVGFFYGGYYFGKSGYIFEVRKNPPKIEIKNQYPGSKEVDFSLFWEVWDIVSKDYLERPVDAEKMLYGAIQGMVSSLGDPYTSFLPPAINKNLNEQLDGKYQGIGAELGQKDNQLIIVAPLDGSPAKAAGLLPGDKILSIEDEMTIGMSITEAVAKIRGDAGTEVKLTIQTGADAPREVALRRDIIKIASVSWKDMSEGTAYIRISRFGGETNKEWDTAVNEISVGMRELDSIIIDVRGNPGGYLLSAAHISSEFFGGKPVLYQEDATGNQTPLNSDTAGSFKDVPRIYVLIDGGSASASEILAAALKAQVNAKLIGTKSFGKGTIQDARDFGDGSGVHITIAKWLTPDKVWVHKVGIEPDVVVEVTEQDIKDLKDPQLDAALELAKEL